MGELGSRTASSPSPLLQSTCLAW